MCCNSLAVVTTLVPTFHHDGWRSGPSFGVQLRLAQYGLQLAGADVEDPGSHLFISLAGHTGYHARGNALLVPRHVLNTTVRQNLLTSTTYHVQYLLLSLVIDMIQGLVFVPHVAVQVELFKLSKPTEA